MESLFKLFETISPSGYQYKDKKSYHPFWMQEGGSEVTSYNDLTDLPKIGGVEVKGNKSLATYHLYSKEEVDALIEAIPSGGGLVKTDITLDVADLQDAGVPYINDLNSDRFTLRFSFSDGRRVVASSGGVVRGYIEDSVEHYPNEYAELAFIYVKTNTMPEEAHLVILAREEVTATIGQIEVIRYSRMSHASNLVTEPKIYLDESCTFHKIELALTSSILYPDGTEEALSVPITVRKILITNNSNYSVQHILHDTGLANMKLGSYGYGTDEETGSFYFSVSRVDYNNKDDLNQDRVYKVTSATMTIVEEW